LRAPKATIDSAKRLRRAMTLPEVVLWSVLRGARIDGLRFRRQHPIGPYVLDFYCPSARLCVEIDGAVHALDAQAGHDRERDAWLAQNGIRVLRVAAADVLDDRCIDDVVRSIVHAAAPSTGYAGPPPP
jgi:very-short-patch-repair endonuclease